MAGKAIPVATEIVLGDALAVITAEQAFKMATADYNKAGVVLVNERVKVFLQTDDGLPVEFTASLYIQRGAMTDDEAAAVAKVAGEREANAKAKKAEEQEKLAREKQAAFKYGQDGMLTALKSIGDLNQAARALAQQVGIKG